MNEATKLKAMVQAQGNLPAMPYVVHDGSGQALPGFNVAPGAAVQNVSGQAPATGGAGGLDPILALAASLLEQQGAQDAQVADLQNKAFGLQQGVIDTMVPRAEAQANIDQQVGNHAIMLQRMFGADPTVANSAVQQSLSTYDEVVNARKGVREAYDQLASVDLLDDPLGWITAQLEMPKIAQQHNSLLAKENQAVDEIRTRTQLVAAMKSTVVANTADAQRSAALEKAAAERDIAQARLYEAQAATLADGAARTLQRMQLMASMEERQDKSAARAAVAKTKEQEAAQINEYEARFKVLADALGLPNAPTWEAVMKYPADQREWWISAADKAAFGSNIYDATREFTRRMNRTQIANQGNIGMLDFAEKVSAASAEYEREAQATLRANNPMVTPKPEDIRRTAAELYQREIEGAVSGSSQYAMNHPRYDSVYNPYKINAVSTAKLLRAKAPNNLVAARIETYLKGRGDYINDLRAEELQNVIDSLVAEAADRKLDPKLVARSLHQFFTAGTELQYSSTKHDLFGIPKRGTYVYRLEGAAGFKPTQVDMLDPARLENAVMEKLRHMRRNMEYIPNLIPSLFGEGLED